MMTRAFALLAAFTLAAFAQQPRTYATRDPHTPGYVRATELPDATLPPANEDGNFILGPTHPPAPEMTANPAVPQGTVTELTLTSADSKFYPGIARDPGTFGTPDPDHPERLILTTSHPHPWTRTVAVYVPHQYVPGAAAPFIVGADGPDRALFTALDNLIAAHKVPIMIAISIQNGGGDAQGSERGLEYDTISGRYAEWVENEVLPLVESQMQRHPHPRSQRPRRHGRLLRRSGLAHHGLVSPRAVPPRPRLLRHVDQPAVALESRYSARRLGLRRSPHP